MKDAGEGLLYGCVQGMACADAHDGVTREPWKSSHVKREIGMSNCLSKSNSYLGELLKG